MTRFGHNVNDKNVINIIPEAELCPDCNQTLIVAKIKKMGILILSLAFDVEVYVKKCENLDCSSLDINVNFQGTKLGIINYNNKFFISIELIKEYFDMFSKNGTPFNSWMLIKLDLTKQAKSNNTKNLPFADIEKIKSYNGVLHETFCEAMELFLYKKDYFICCQSPKVLQMDGVVISIKTSRMPQLQIPWVKSEIIGRASTRHARQLDPLDKEISKLITNILETKSCTPDQKENLKNSTNIGVRVLYFCLETHGENYKLFNGTEHFAKTLTKKVAAVASILPKSSVVILEK